LKDKQSGDNTIEISSEGASLKLTMLVMSVYNVLDLENGRLSLAVMRI
jgi:hypothetical protein